MFSVYFLFEQHQNLLFVNFTKIFLISRLFLTINIQNFETFEEVYDVMMMPGPVIFFPEALN